MNWNDYEAIWKRQELPVGAGADLASLKATFETKHRKLAATLFIRDIAEAAAGVLVAGAISFMWWKQGTTGWPLSIALVLILGVTGVFIKERLRTHRQRLGAEAPMLARLEAEIAELQHQRHLLLRVRTWYLLPCAAAILIVLATVLRNAPAEALADHWPIIGGFFGAYLVLLCFLFWLAWRINRQAVRKQIEPRLAELESLRRELLASSET